MTSIAIVGAGHIGGNLARKWAARGHAVTFGARDPAKSELVQLAAGLGARVTEIHGAVRRSEVVVFAIPADAMAQTAAGLGASLGGKVVIDTTNNVRAKEMNSLAAISAAASSAAYYRAFNSYGWEQIEQPVVAGTQADAFYCGPDGSSRTVVEQLIVDIGLRPIWLGGLDQVDVVDGLIQLWWTLVRGQGHSRRLAFKLLEG